MFFYRTAADMKSVAKQDSFLWFYAPIPMGNEPAKKPRLRGELA